MPTEPENFVFCSGVTLWSSQSIFLSLCSGITLGDSWGTGDKLVSATAYKYRSLMCQLSGACPGDLWLFLNTYFTFAIIFHFENKVYTNDVNVQKTKVSIPIDLTV